MDHSDHVNLLRNGVVATGGVWADLGAGSGAFTLALAELLGPGGEIHVVDRDSKALRANAEATCRRFPANAVHYRTADFTEALELSQLDGIVMANSLHFQLEQDAVVRLVRGYLRTGGRLLVVEYNINRGNFAVPYPVPYASWERMARAAGFSHTELLGRRPSRFLKEIYSAASW
ncbi:MAG: methyltransferase domain-containing protein [Dehalococcoidia bacterium]|nr:methyltransferase domain-containing protein [Dehalococcoidia bacterium]MCB9484618.1 methyltransferase domain-containing protein [Thermoflexaceae bacterium]